MNHLDSSPTAPLLQSTPPTSPPRLSSEASDAYTSLLPQPPFQKISTPKLLRPTIKNKMAAANPLSKSDTDHLYHSLDEEENLDLESQAIIAMRRNQMVLVRVDKVLITYYIVMLLLLVNTLVVLPIVCYNLKEYKSDVNQ